MHMHLHASTSQRATTLRPCSRRSKSFKPGTRRLSLVLADPLHLNLAAIQANSRQPKAKTEKMPHRNVVSGENDGRGAAGTQGA